MTDAAIGDKATRVARIHAALAALEPIAVALVDESHRHAGHEGARDGRGHYALRIVSARFSGMGAVARHRAVYAAAGDLMRSDIHALSIVAVAPEETGAGELT